MVILKLLPYEAVAQEWGRRFLRRFCRSNGSLREPVDLLQFSGAKFGKITFLRRSAKSCIFCYRLRPLPQYIVVLGLDFPKGARYDIFARPTGIIQIVYPIIDHTNRGNLEEADHEDHQAQRQ